MTESEVPYPPILYTSAQRRVVATSAGRLAFENRKRKHLSLMVTANTTRRQGLPSSALLRHLI